MRSELPKARLEVRGAAGHLERATAAAKQGARVAGQVSLGVIKLVSGVIGFGVFCAVIVALGGTGVHNPRLERDLERIRHMQDSMRLHDHHMQEAQIRALVEASRWQPAPLSSYAYTSGSDPMVRDRPTHAATEASAKARPARVETAPRPGKTKAGTAAPTR